MELFIDIALYYGISKTYLSKSFRSRYIFNHPSLYSFLYILEICFVTVNFISEICSINCRYTDFFTFWRHFVAVMSFWRSAQSSSLYLFLLYYQRLILSITIFIIEIYSIIEIGFISLKSLGIKLFI